MKRKLSIVFFLAGLLMFAQASYAQVGQVGFGASAGVNLPVGTLGDRYNASFGVQGSFRYQAMEEVVIGLNAGYNRFSIGSAFSRGSQDFIPVTGFFEYYLSDESIRPYIGLDAGVYIYRGSQWVSGINQLTVQTEAKFGAAPVFGLLFETAERFYVNGSVRYNYVMNTLEGSNVSRPYSWFGLNVGIVYMLSN
ncbi:outer membrane beta-barrel protein [Cytophagaceae bacterium ABcell3]|nr:outer membrane beta-barrel protein [Cytophagaceae bacterium ABcell3]